MKRMCMIFKFRIRQYNYTLNEPFSIRPFTNIYITSCGTYIHTIIVFINRIERKGRRIGWVNLIKKLHQF